MMGRKSKPDRIVHDYGHVVLNVVYEALTEDIPKLLGSLI